MEKDASSKFSPSKLDVFKECPQRYQFRYVDKISRKRKTPETVVGVAVHAAFEELYGLVSGGKTPSLAEVQALYDDALNEEWDETVVVRDPRFARDDWKNVGAQCVELYYKAHHPFTEDRTVAVEKRVGFPLVVDGREYRIEGFVDRLSLAPDGTFVIHDYKTAKSLPNQEHADADWQLALYEIAVRREWPDAKGVRLQWHYVRHGKTLTSARDEAARARLLEDVVATVRAIKRADEFPPKKGPLCDWCEYRDLCPEFKHETRVAALPPAERKKDDGVRLVDALTEIDSKRRRLKDEELALEEQKKGIEDELARFAEDEGLSTVAGSRAEASVSVRTEVRLPTKTDDRDKNAALEKEVRETPLWAEVAHLDGRALVKGVQDGRWTGENLTVALKLLDAYGHKETTRTVRLKRRRGGDED
ncbi:MAG: PD-(D/E)XK nuclease family protein [Elusimicrobia bacterium]|nr:PD-(D/E)XK nuclease family protein [Elusimicrobiota bacterium]